MCTKWKKKLGRQIENAERKYKVTSDIPLISDKYKYILNTLSKVAWYYSSVYNVCCLIVKPLNHKLIFTQKVHKSFQSAITVDNICSPIKEVIHFSKIWATHSSIMGSIKYFHLWTSNNLGELVPISSPDLLKVLSFGKQNKKPNKIQDES